MTTVKVTQECIDHGVRRTCGDCPVALAIKAICRRSVRVSVGWFIILWREMEEWQCCAGVDLPSVDQFTRAFDTGQPVSPFEFELDIPAWALREAA